GYTAHRPCEVALVDEHVDPDRQVGAMLLDRRHRQYRDDLAHVGGGKIAPAHLGPELGWQHPDLQKRSTRTRGDGLDLDLEFGAGETLDDNQSRSRGRIAPKFVTPLHVAAQILGRSDIGIQADEIPERHRRFAKDRLNGVKAKTRLRFHVVGNDAVAADSQLARTEDDPRAGFD